MKRATSVVVGALVMVVTSTTVAFADVITGPRIDLVPTDPYSAGMFVGAALIVIGVVALGWFALRGMARRRKADNASKTKGGDTHVE